MKDWSTTPEKTADSPDGRPDRLAPAEGRDGSVHRVGPRSREPWPRWTSALGSPNPPGASWVEEEQAYNFSLYSRARRARDAPPLRRGRPGPPARRVPAGPAAEQDLEPLALPAGRGRDRGRPLLRLLGSTARAAGPGRWHAYDPEKVLLDPYAKEVFFPPSFDREAARRPGPNAGMAPLGVLPRRRAGVRLGRRPAPAPRVGHGHLRDARPRLHAEPDERRLARGSGGPTPAWPRRCPT